MSKNRCVAEKGEDLPLNISVAIEFVFSVLFNHYGSERTLGCWGKWAG